MYIFSIVRGPAVLTDVLSIVSGPGFLPDVHRKVRGPAVLPDKHSIVRGPAESESNNKHSSNLDCLDLGSSYHAFTAGLGIILLLLQQYL